jgi:hypothetical protein
MRLAIVLLAGLTMSACTASSPLSSSSGPWRFSGTVSRLDGAQVGGPIAGAELTVLSGSNTNARVTTDAGGRYAFTALESGRFTVAIAAPGYQRATPVVDLYRDIEANFALKPQ